MTNPTRVITPSKTPRTRSKGEKKISLGGKQMRGVVVRHFVLKRALYAAKVLCKMSAAVETRTSLFWRIADGQSQTCERNGLRKGHDHLTVAVQWDRSYAGKRREKTEEARENSVSCVRALCKQSAGWSGDEDRTKRL